MSALHAIPEAAAQIWVRGAAVEDCHKARVLAQYADDAELISPRVELPIAVGAEVAALRRASGQTVRSLCEQIGIRQPVTIRLPGKAVAPGRDWIAGSPIWRPSVLM
ncbi:MAG: hypothetical protein MZV65_42670 [Chromatiales bacterium]|nr:hypothetical protein [Chromatiales bacterium]